MVQAQLGAPLRVGQRELGAKKPAQGAFGDRDAPPDLGQGQRCRQIRGDQRAGLAQPPVDRGGQPHRLTLIGGVEVIVQHRQHPVVGGRSGVDAARTGDDQLAQQRVDRDHRRGGRHPAVAPRIQGDGVEPGLPVEAVLVPLAGRDPDGAVGGVIQVPAAVVTDTAPRDG